MSRNSLFSVPRLSLYSTYISFLILLVLDMPDSDLLSHFHQALDFIEDGIKNGTVLVHWWEYITVDSIVNTYCFN